MKKVKVFSLVLLSTLLFFNCRKNDDTKINEVSSLAFTKRDKDYQDLAKVISVAINRNDDFRKLVKKEALKKFDGDYDILIKNFKNQKVTSDSKSSKKISIGSLLSNYAKDLDIIKENKSSAQDYIDQLSQMYPNLQISIPVHADEWTDDYIPKITFIPENLTDGENRDIIAYQNTNVTSVNSSIAPDDPVIVIGDNERINPIDDNLLPPSVNITLQSSQTQSGIRLQWTTSNNGNNYDILGYHIYRKDANSYTFTHIGSSYGIFNLTYNDNDVIPMASYSYYVTAFNAAGDSSPSNIVNQQAPDVPLPVNNFSATLNTPNDLELRWDNPNGQYIDYTALSKMIVGVDNDYQQFAQVNRNTHYYIDHNITAGKKVIYKCNEIVNGNTSNAKYDFVKVPYRDVSQPTAVYIERIKFNYSDISHIEGWMRGAPEFRFAVAMGSPNNGVPIQKNMMFQFCNRHSWNNFNGRNVYNWEPSNWSEVLTFKAIEVDGGPDVDLNLSAKYKTKNADKTAFGVDGSVTVKITDFFDSDDEDMGIGYLRYYDPTTTWVHFSNYGFKIKISTVDTTETCYP